MGKVKEPAETAEDARKAADDAKVREIRARLRALKNPTNHEILDLLMQLPRAPEEGPSAAEIIRELRGPLPGDPGAEPLPPE